MCGGNWQLREWCCSATCTRTSLPPVARRTRSAILGTSSDLPVARAAAQPRRSRRSWFPPPPAPTPRDRCGSHRRAAAPRRSSRRVAWCRCAESCRWRGASTTPARWRARLADCRLLLAAMAGRDGERAESALQALPALRPAASRPDRSPARGLGFLRARRERSSTPTWRRASSSRWTRAVVLAPCSSSRRPPRADGGGRRLPRRPDDGAARVSPPVRRQARALPPVVARMGRGRGAACRFREGVRCGAGAAASRHAAWASWLDEHRLGRGRRADDPDRRSVAWGWVRACGQRLRADLAHAPLGLDGLPRGRPSRQASAVAAFPSGSL